MLVIGERPGKYRDPLTKKMLDLQSRDPLIRIVGSRFPMKDGVQDNSQPPIEFSIVAGQWVERFRNNPAVLTYFGDIQKIAAIPAGHTPGAWAHGIGPALRQRWRESASRMKVTHHGDDNRVVARREKPFTRRELFNTFRPIPDVYDILASANPGRAKKNWDEMVKHLKDAHVIKYYKEMAPLPEKEQGWQDAWLDQPLDIRPDQEGMEALAKLNRGALAATRKAKTARKTCT